MYELNSLNDHEFELLIKDILQLAFKVKLYSFPRGRDQGVDICDDHKPPKYMIQVKHYKKSSFRNLIKSLRQEVAKVKAINPKKYYICTSQELTRRQKLEITALFGKFTPDISHVIDKIEINTYLESEVYKDIVSRHYKLWLASSTVFTLINNKDVLIDCEELITEINAYKKLFVDTKNYYQALKILNKQHIVILTGDPGSGKSTISKMLLLQYIAQGYAVRYSSGSDIATLKKVLSSDPKKKEIILIDDFLGQHYLKIHTNRAVELKTLLSNVMRMQRKRIILNSRITILNEAKHSSAVFNDLLDRYEGANLTIDLNGMDIYEKACILYNHLYFNSIPKRHFNAIKADKLYMGIIWHPNYSPRIIEYITRKSVYSKIKPKEYAEFIFDKLNNPQDIWNDEYMNNIEEVDRILLNTLYSLTDTYISVNDLRKAFNNRVAGRYTTTKNPFNSALKRLNNSLTKMGACKNKPLISMTNPSLNDYIRHQLAENELECIEIVKHGVFVEQYSKVLDINPDSAYIKNHIISKILSGEFITMQALKKAQVYLLLLRYINRYRLMEPALADMIREAAEYLCRGELFRNSVNIVYPCEDLAEILLTDKLYDFYQLEDLCKDKDVLNLLTFDEVLALYHKMEGLQIMDDNIFQFYWKYLFGKLKSIIYYNIHKRLDKIVEKIIEELRYESNEDVIYEKVKIKINTLCRQIIVKQLKTVRKHESLP